MTVKIYALEIIKHDLFKLIFFLNITNFYLYIFVYIINIIYLHTIDMIAIYFI